MSNSLPDPEARVRVSHVAILILSVLILCALAADTLWVLPKEISTLIHWVDTAVCLVFLAEFGVRLYRAPSRLEFLKWGWIDLVASIPNLAVLRWGRLVAVLRVIRLLRGVRTVERILRLMLKNKAESGVVSIGLTAFLLVAFSSISILICEQAGTANIKTGEDAVWWSVATLTTVGYGDKYPVTTEGRVLGMILMMAGVGLFGGLSGLVASLFLGAQDGQSPEHKEILARLSVLEGKLDALNYPPARRGGGPPAP